MPTEKRVPSLIVNTLTQAQYEALENPSDTEMWVTPYDESILPDQTGQSGKFLTTDGTAASWASAGTLPSQTGQSGKFLTTNGTTPSWAEIPTDVDNKSVSLNSNDEIQTVGVIDQNDTTKAIKTWTGTKAEYDAIATKYADTIYNITDDTVLTDFANTSLSNLTNAGKIVGAGLGMPSGIYEDLTLGADGTTYTSPSNGYFFLFARQASLNAGIGLGCGGIETWEQPAEQSNFIMRTFLPVKKGATVTSYTYGSVTDVIFRFVYAEGSKSEAN